MGSVGKEPCNINSAGKNCYNNCPSSLYQVTFQACSISEARYLYDQLATICPIVVSNALLSHQIFVMCKPLRVKNKIRIKSLNTNNKFNTLGKALVSLTMLSH